MGGFPPILENFTRAEQYWSQLVEDNGLENLDVVEKSSQVKDVPDKNLVSSLSYISVTIQLIYHRKKG